MKFKIERTKTNQFCDLSFPERKRANLVIKKSHAIVDVNGIYINEETFLNAIKNSSDEIKKTILGVLSKNKKVVKKEVFTQKEKELLKYDLRKLKTDEHKERFWASLTSLADKFKVDYNDIKEDEYKKLRDKLVEKLI